ncbi:hypothetical protein RhiirA5_508006 [Rhizophagus irregularis]|uniref:Uncharacterized protein n=1 Tax=Rhizophagus irregularis TaxID=588596 RepID=A0A2N0NFJ8_9GLOM|nr:hypothetical protein RhiirA5_508006 [Rhizophagus irregularis]
MLYVLNKESQKVLNLLLTQSPKLKSKLKFNKKVKIKSNLKGVSLFVSGVKTWDYNSFYDFPWIPKWNAIVIEKSLRKLITLTTNTKNLERFLNLNRNVKYRKCEIDWSIFFNNFLGEKQKLYTDFKESKIRRRKIQLMI